MKRRAFVALGVSAAPAFLLPEFGRAANARIEQLEHESGGRLGVFVKREGRTLIAHRADERFLTCSTFKVLLVAAVLSRVDSGRESLERRIAFGPARILAYAPVAREHLSRGYMTVRELCAAAIRYSDNTAADLLIDEIGGPARITAYARSIGDAVTIMRRREPLLNVPAPDGVSDTTSPRAMAHDIGVLLYGDALGMATSALLIDWMHSSPITRTLLRAGVPRAWEVVDKSGTGGRINAHQDSDTRNDIGALGPRQGPPIIAAVYLTGCTLPAAQRDSIIARVGREIENAVQ